MNFWRLWLTLPLLCVLLLGAALGIGHLLPMPADATVLARNPCTLPCFYGVTPAKTTRTQALQILAPYLDGSEVNAASISFPLTDEQGHRSLVSVSFDSDGVVDSIQMIGIDPLVNMGQLSDLL